MSRKKKVKDPFAAREAEKYAKPIPSREAILTYLDSQKKMFKLEHIAAAMRLNDEEDLTALSRRLGAMVRDGQLMRNRRKGFGIAKKLDMLHGRVIGHADGFGFFRPDSGDEDVFIPPKQMRQVLHGDRVLLAITGSDRRGRPEGQIVEVLERANETLVGHFVEESGVSFVVADDQRIHQDLIIVPGGSAGAENGALVFARITRQPGFRHQPLGEIIQVMGMPGDPGLAVDVAIRKAGLRVDWPDALLGECDKTINRTRIEPSKTRRDLRKLDFVTIDGADARDFDDAIYCEKRGDLTRLWVAIADVSAYVKPGSKVDAEAYERATSAYFPNRVLPMLPEALSNGACSLRPDEDRLAFICQMDVDSGGQIKQYDFYRAIICSSARLTYSQVQEWIDKGGKLPSGHATARRSKEIARLYTLFGDFRKEREARGAIDFVSRGSRFQFDENGAVAGIIPEQQLPAHQLIEECMVAANRCAAMFISKHSISGPYRIHPRPQERKLGDLKQFLNQMGVKEKLSDSPDGEDIRRILDSVKDRMDAPLIQAVMLRAQSLAMYQTDNVGHFGLGLEFYAHFTSPIRRYADLLVHRAIGHILDHGSKAGFPYQGNQMEVMSEHCSLMDRKTEEAARDADDRLRCIFMQDHVGDEFEGMVSGVTNFGLFVELDDTLVNGLVHITSLPNDYYHFDPIAHRLTGERAGRKFQLADRLKITVTRVDVEDRKIDFELAP